MVKRRADTSGADRQLWDRLARGWEKWWPLQERAFTCVNESLLRLAFIKPGHSVLDIGTGIGEPALAAGFRVGPAGRVVAMDCSPHMLAVAQKRVHSAGLANVSFLETDVDGMAFPEAAFDAIVCRFSLMFLPDIRGALSKIKPLLREGGFFAASVWDEASRVPMLSLALDLAQSVFDVPPPPPGTPSIYCLAEGRLEQNLAAAGFQDIQTESLSCVFEASSSLEYAQFLRDVNAPLANMLAEQPENRREDFWRELETQVRPYVAPDGSVRLPGSVLCAAGRKEHRPL